MEDIDDDSVGKHISTKLVGRDGRNDLTGDYKYEKGVYLY